MLQNRSAKWKYTSSPEDSIQACTDIEQQIMDWGYEHALALKLNLVVEELFLNTIKYGRTGTDQVGVEIWLEEDTKQHILLTYKDAGPEYNPLTQDEDPDPESRIGGRGIILIKGLSQTAQFIRTDNWNHLILEFSSE